MYIANFNTLLIGVTSLSAKLIRTSRRKTNYGTISLEYYGYSHHKYETSSSLLLLAHRLCQSVLGVLQSFHALF